MEQYILAIDAGTTSARCILFDRAGQMCAVAQKELHLNYPHDGWVEQDAMEIWKTQLQVCRSAMSVHLIQPEQIVAIGITNQRETTIVWDKATGKPIAPAIVKPVLWSMRISLRPNCAGFWIRFPARVSGRKTANCCSAQWTAG